MEGRYRLELGLHLEPPADVPTRIAALWGDALLAHHQAEDRVAKKCADELHALGSQHADTAALRHAATIHAMVAIGQQQPVIALSRFEDALRLAHRAGDDWLVTTSLLNVGLGQLNTDCLQAARSTLAEAISRTNA